MRGSLSTFSLETQGAVYSTILLIVVVGCHRICKFFIRGKHIGNETSPGGVDEVIRLDTTQETGSPPSVINHVLTDSEVERKQCGAMLFAEFQLRYLTVYAVAFVADYIGAAYVYSMFSDYLNLPASTVLHLMQIPYIGTAVATLISSPLIDAHGRRAGFAITMLLFCVRYLVVILCPPFDPATAPTGNPSFLIYALCVISQVLYGTALALLYSVPETWMVAEHSRRGYPVELLTSTYSRSYFINAIVGILGVQGARWYRDWCGLDPRIALGVVLGFGGAMCAVDAVLTMILWTENTGKAEGPIGRKTQEGGSSPDKGSPEKLEWWQNLPDIPRILVYATICIFSSFQMFAVGAGQCLQDAGSWIFVGIWTPVLETKEYENVLTSQLLLQGLGSYAVQFFCRGDDTVASVLGLEEPGAIQVKKKKGLSIRSTVLSYHLVILAGLAACALAPTKPWFLAANLASTFGYGFYFSVYGHLKALVVPKEGRVVIVSLFALPASLATYFGSKFFDAAKPQSMYWLAFFYQGLSLVVILLAGVAVYMKRQKRTRLLNDENGEKLPLWHPDHQSIALD